MSIIWIVIIIAAVAAVVVVLLCTLYGVGVTCDITKANFELVHKCVYLPNKIRQKRKGENNIRNRYYHELKNVSP